MIPRELREIYEAYAYQTFDIRQNFIDRLRKRVALTHGNGVIFYVYLHRPEFHISIAPWAALMRSVFRL